MTLAGATRARRIHASPLTRAVGRSPFCAAGFATRSSAQSPLNQNSNTETAIATAIPIAQIALGKDRRVTTDERRVKRARYACFGVLFQPDAARGTVVGYTQEPR